MLRLHIGTTWEKKGERLLMKLISKLEAPLLSMLISPNLFTKEIFLAIKSF